MLRTGLLTFRVSGAVFKIHVAAEMWQLPAYFDNPVFMLFKFSAGLILNL